MLLTLKITPWGWNKQQNNSRVDRRRTGRPWLPGTLADLGHRMELASVEAELTPPKCLLARLEPLTPPRCPLAWLEPPGCVRAEWS